jgi:ATP-dependent helicase/nuclease subunit B
LRSAEAKRAKIGSKSQKKESLMSPAARVGKKDSVPQPIFLGLDRPPLVAAVDWLLDHFPIGTGTGKEWDLSGLIVTLPTSRAQQRFLQLLCSRARQKNVQLSAPFVLTIGELPEFLYEAEKPLASNLVQNLAWGTALAEMPAEDFSQLTGRDPQERPDDWEPLAALVASLHQRLSSDIWSFRSVAARLAEETGFLKAELQRWQVLERLQSRYYRILNELDLWDRQAARNYAAGGLLKANELRCRTDKTVVMLAVADLSRSVSEMLRQIHQQNPEQVKILIADAVEHQNRFDPFGSLITAQWLGQPISFANHQIRVAETPADQAFLTSQFLRSRDGFVSDEMTIGVPDENVIPQLERELNRLRIPFRTLPGKPLSGTAPFRLLKYCGLYLQSFSYESFASLVRHPDLFSWLSRKVDRSDWLQELTLFQNQKLPDQIAIDQQLAFGDPRLIGQQYDPADPGSVRRATARASVTELLNCVLGGLRELFSEFQTPAATLPVWSERWKNLLSRIYEDHSASQPVLRTHELSVALPLLYQAFDNQASVPIELQFPTSAIRSLNLALKEISDRRVPPLENPEAIELAGWLDLPLDDAPVLVITGMNDGSVPTSERGHPFLPNELCKKLQILDNDRRYARDCYAMSVIANVRKELLLIAGRRDSQAEPLKPSRLLFADTAEIAALRAKAFFEFTGGDLGPTDPIDPFPAPPEQQLAFPEPREFQPLNQITVTRFRDYIKCPYRFYLRHVMRLETVNDDVRELDAGMFGDLIHNCLEAFGKSRFADSSDPNQILSFLNQQLDEAVQQSNIGAGLPAVEIQIAQARQRFEIFAQQQAQRRQQGWRIVSTEESLAHPFDVDGQPFIIRGKIDRIDQHQETGQIAIWDYKTSDSGTKPGPAHYAPKLGIWYDLQLPLYRHLLKEVAAVAGCNLNDLILGYILLPKRLEEIGFIEADWTEAQLATADELAVSIMRQIRNSVFWPPVFPAPLYSEDFAPICQDNVFERWAV